MSAIEILNTVLPSFAPESIRENHLGQSVEVSSPTEVPIEDYRPATPEEIETNKGAS